MDKDRVEGAGKNIAGKIKEGVGKITGDTKTEAEGKADQVEGKVQNTMGGIKDKAREVFQQIAQGEWQPRFQGIKQQAKNALGKR